MFDRWRKRRALLAEAARLEAEAREARTSLAQSIARAWGPGLAAMACLAAISASNFASSTDGRECAAMVRESLLSTDGARAAGLEARARALRQEALGRDVAPR